MKYEYGSVEYEGNDFYFEKRRKAFTNDRSSEIIAFSFPSKALECGAKRRANVLMVSRALVGKRHDI